MPNTHRRSTYWRLAKLALSILTAHTSLAEARAAEAVTTERGPHHRTWSQQSISQLPDGSIRTNQSSFSELEVGLHYLKDNQWLLSKEEIELVANGAVARQGPHQVIWSPNIASFGAIDVLTSDGIRLRSHVLGLGLYDRATGQSVLLAEVKDSIGEFQPPNQVFYREAFDGVVADLRYTYRKGSFVQDVIVLERIRLPEGFNEDSTQLEVWTEFVEAAVPQKTESLRSGMIDEALDFGAMRIGGGKAFALGSAPGAGTPVAKRWLLIEGRTFLVEAVRYSSVKAELERLPAAQAAIRPRAVFQVAASRPFPTARPAAAFGPEPKIQVAVLPPPTRGFVLDYDLSASLSDFTFHRDKTYYVSGSTALSGLTTFEGGCVIKYAPTNNATLLTSGEVKWLTAFYQPVVFTARDDHSVGTPIGSASLSGKYADIALFVDAPPLNPLRHLRISHANYGLVATFAIELAHAQFVSCGTALAGADNAFRLANTLIFDCSTVFDGNDLSISGANLTVHQCGTFNVGSSSVAALTNSLFVYQTNWGSVSKTLSFCHETNGAAFQTVGAASHYLMANSSLRNVGTTNIGAGLLADLRVLTTYPPVVIDGGYPVSVWTNDLTLYPQAQRDTDVEDLGYHYPPLDYVIGGLVLTNATLTAMPGVALGIYTRSSVGIGLRGGAKFFSEGTPTKLNRIVRYNTVQEQANTNWASTGSAFNVLTEWIGSTAATESRFRFTQWSVMAIDAIHFSAFVDGPGNHRFIDSQFHGGSWESGGPNVYLTNCLWERCPVTLFDNTGTQDAEFWNNTFYGGEHSLFQTGGSWTFKDNLFAEAVLITDGSMTGDYNAYTTNATRITPNGANDVLLSVTNVAFQSGWLGRFYLPTNLTSHSVMLNEGSRTAAAGGLYHYTTATNQTKEASTDVDIGFHYVALDSSGQSLDYDGDGLPDYLEDLDGDGVPDSGETSWQGYNSLNSLSGTPGIQVFTPLK